MRNIRFWLPMIMLRYSEKPPIMAPIRFAPKKEDGFDAWRKVVEKIRPAKKIGRGTTRRAHSKRSSKLNARIESRLTKYSSNKVVINGAYSHIRKRLIRMAKMFAANTIRRTPATTTRVTNHVVPK